MQIQQSNCFKDAHDCDGRYTGAVSEREAMYERNKIESELLASARIGCISLENIA